MKRQFSDSRVGPRQRGAFLNSECFLSLENQEKRFAKRQTDLSGDTFSIEAPPNFLRTKKYSKNICSGKEFAFKGGSKLLRTFFWCLYRKGVASHAYLKTGYFSEFGMFAPEKQKEFTNIGAIRYVAPIGAFFCTSVSPINRH